MSSTKGSDIVSCIFLRNSRNEEMILSIEPWGDELKLAPSVLYKIQLTSPNHNGLQIDCPENGVVLYAPSESILTVFEGDKIVQDYPIRVPRLPTSAI